MSNQTLRELAKDYARGIIDKEDYRKSRAELITGITTGQVPVKIIDYPPPLMPSDGDDQAITEGLERDGTEITSPSVKKPKPVNQSTTSSPKPSSPASQPNKKSPVVFITISAVIVVLLITGVVLFYPKPPETDSLNTTSKEATEASTNIAVSTGNMPGESLIADFLSEKNWSEDSLNTFVTSWSALTEDQRSTAKQTKRMQRMHDSIYKQFLEGKALASIDSEKAISKQQKLIEFAAAIGISDSRLVIDL